MSIKKHNLVPKHTLLTDKQKEKLLADLHVTIKELPKIRLSDSAIQPLEAKSNDIIKISRESRSAGNSVYYRIVIE